ncbi:M23 family metallopeptidase [Thermodesulfobacteriota bacterium]
MDSGKTLTDLTVTLSFWIGIVFVLLSVHGNINDNATATPISLNLELQTPVESDASTFEPAKVKSVLPETSPEIHTEITGELKRGESFDLAMKRLKVSDSVRLNVIKGFQKSLDFKMLHPGDRFSIILEQDNSIARATYESSLLKTHILERNEDGNYWSTRQAVPLEYRIERLSGVIDSSLYAAFCKLGEEPKLIHAYADIFASKIDFNTETRVNDRFELLVEKYYKDDVFVGYGKILVASYKKQNIEYQGYHFASENTPSGYFDQKGEALGTWFIRSPIPFGRVTSRFTMKRKHPVDGIVRPHLGVDLAAPRGTAVMATAEGRVEFIGRKGGFGKSIILRHHGGYKTYYGHLNGYKKGLNKGSIVQQKDIIGYVGSTGKSTGPHLDYRIQLNGVFRNPFGIKFKAKTILKDEELALFLQSSNMVAELFKADTSEKTLQVKNVTLTEDHSISFL